MPTDFDLSRDIWTISRLAREARAVLEGSFPLLWVEGEISNLSQPASGHLYFALKDPAAQIRCALFRNKRLLLGFRPANGQQVLARVRVTLYEGRGDFQLVVEHLEPAGEGALRLEFERLKRKLAAEGLFDAALKRPPAGLSPPGGPHHLPQRRGGAGPHQRPGPAFSGPAPGGLSRPRPGRGRGGGTGGDAGPG